MTRWLWVAIGGAVGTLGRYWVSGLDYRWSGGVFPVSTLIVNLAGCLVIGFLWGISERIMLPPDLRMFLFIGVLGGFTTFSTFGLETFNLLRDGEVRIALANLLISNLAGVVLVYAGYGSSQYLLSLFHSGA